MTMAGLTSGEKKILLESHTAVPTKRHKSFGALFSHSDDAQKKLKKKNNAVRKLFGVEDDLVVDVSARLTTSSKITLPGRLFLMRKHFLFYSDLFEIEQKVKIPICDVVEITKVDDQTVVIETREHQTFTFNPVGRFKDQIYQKMVAIRSSATECNIAAPVEDDPRTDESGTSDDEEDDEGFEWIAKAAKEEGFLNTDLEGERVELMSNELPVSVKQFYKLFLQDETFYKLYHERRGDTDIEITPWNSDPELGNVRQLRFRIKVKSTPFGPPTALVDETQRYYHQGGDPNHLVVETMTSVRDVQYADSFRVEGRIDVTAKDGDSNRVKVVVGIGVSFLKKIRLPGVTGTIRSRSIEDNKQSFLLFMNLANEIASTAAPETLASASGSHGSPTTGEPQASSNLPTMGSLPSSKTIVTTSSTAPSPNASAQLSTPPLSPLISTPTPSTSFISSWMSPNSLLLISVLVALLLIFSQLIYIRSSIARLEGLVTAQVHLCRVHEAPVPP